MDRTFLSMTDNDIPDDKMRNEMIPKLHNFILEIYETKKAVLESKESKAKNLKKFKLIMDIVEIYNDPDILKLIKEYKEEQIREAKRQEAIKKRRASASNNSFGLGGFSLFGNFWDNNDSSSDESERRSDISEDEFEQDNYTKMLDDSYAGIESNSTLRHVVGITRVYETQLEDPVPAESDVKSVESEKDTRVAQSVPVEGADDGEKVSKTNESTNHVASVASVVTDTVIKNATPTYIS